MIIAVEVFPTIPAFMDLMILPVLGAFHATGCPSSDWGWEWKVWGGGEGEWREEGGGGGGGGGGGEEE